MRTRGGGQRGRCSGIFFLRLTSVELGLLLFAVSWGGLLGVFLGHRVKLSSAL